MAITITTWNVQNLTRNNPIFSDKLDYLVGTLQQLHSDIVALQEVLDTDALDELANRLDFNAYSAQPDERGNRVAFLTRTAVANPPIEITDWNIPRNEEVRRFDSNGDIVVCREFPRPALQITVQHNGNEIDIITTHLKSKLLTFGNYFSTNDEGLRAQTAYFALQRRAAEACTLRAVATQLLANGRNVVLLGDFNDVHEAATTQILFGPSGSQPRGPEDANRSSGSFQRSDNGDAQRLFNITNLVPWDIRWTRKHQGQEELLDHILASVNLMPRDADDLRQVPEVNILNDETPSLVGVNPAAGVAVPDHAPVTASFV